MRTRTSPLLIPMSFIEKEKEHVAGFKPELGGGDPRRGEGAGGSAGDPPPPPRPSSTTCSPSGCQSYRDLPILNEPVGQRDALGNSGPGSSCGPPSSSGRRGTRRMPPMTRPRRRPAPCWGSTGPSWRSYIAMPVITGLKSESEKFAGALRTYACEALMQDKPGAAGRDLPQPGAELREAVRSQVPVGGGEGGVRLEYLLGGPPPGWWEG